MLSEQRTAMFGYRCLLCESIIASENCMDHAQSCRHPHKETLLSALEPLMSSDDIGWVMSCIHAESTASDYAMAYTRFTHKIKTAALPTEELRRANRAFRDELVKRMCKEGVGQDRISFECAIDYLFPSHTLMYPSLRAQLLKTYHSHVAREVGIEMPFPSNQSRRRPRKRKKAPIDSAKGRVTETGEDAIDARGSLVAELVTWAMWPTF